MLSMGESWHNLHHADPTCARTGVLRGQVDSGARVIQLFEAFGWAYDVRWPRQERLDARRASLIDGTTGQRPHRQPASPRNATAGSG